MIARTILLPVLSAMFLATMATMTTMTGGCAKKSTADASMAPGAGEDDLIALEQQLARRESELQAIGISQNARKNVTTLDTAGAGSSAKGDGGADASAPVPSTGPAPSIALQPADPDRKPDDPGRCERVCEISAAICTLEEQICGLLPRHRGEARYQGACDRSVADCQLATEACHACTAN